MPYLTPDEFEEEVIKRMDEATYRLRKCLEEYRELARQGLVPEDRPISISSDALVSSMEKTGPISKLIASLESDLEMVRKGVYAFRHPSEIRKSRERRAKKRKS